MHICNRGKREKLGFVGELGADLFEFLGSEVESATMLPGFVERHEVNVSVGNVGADDFPEDALAQGFFHVLAEFFDGRHKGFVVGVGEVIDFVDLSFGDYKDVTLGFGVDVEKGTGFVVFVNFV